MESKEKLKNSFFWNSIEKFGVKGIQFFISIILARILTPKEYGIVGIVNILIVISQVFIESGFTKALIYKKDRNIKDYSTVFYFNFFMSLFIVCIIWILAPLIENFYGIMNLKEIIRILSFSLIINALSMIQNTYLEVNMNFKIRAKINFFAIIISGTISILLALNNFGVWALVFQNIINNLIVTILLYCWVKILPEFYFCLKTLKNLFVYSSKLLVCSLFSTLFNQMYTIIIGKVYNTEELGYYERGNQFAELLSGTIGSIVQTVTFPYLCSLKDENELFVKSFKKINKIIIMVIIPLMLLLSILSKPLIIFLLTEKWIGAAFILKWTALTYIFTPISALNLNILNAIGRTDLYLKIDTSKIPIVLITMLLTIPYGIKIFVIGRFIATIICFLINTYYSKKLFQYGIIEQIKDSKKIIVAGILMYIIIIELIKILKKEIYQLLFGSVLGIILYIILLLLFSVDEVKLIKDFIFKNKKGVL